MIVCARCNGPGQKRLVIHSSTPLHLLDSMRLMRRWNRSAPLSLRCGVIWGTNWGTQSSVTVHSLDVVQRGSRTMCVVEVTTQGGESESHPLPVQSMRGTNYCIRAPSRAGYSPG